jgi:hypothetical protein
METLKKCQITRYDETINEPPYVTIPFDKMEILKPEHDKLGEEFCERLIRTCKSKGYIFRFYTISNNKDFDYEVVVY